MLVISVVAVVALVCYGVILASGTVPTPVKKKVSLPSVVKFGKGIVINRKFSVVGVKVRDLKPPVGIFIYKTSTDVTGEGFKYEVWIYNVSKLNNTAYLIIRNVTIFMNDKPFSNYIETYIVKNNIVYFIDAKTGNVVYKFNVVEAPVSPDCVSLLVAPPFWPYVREGAKWRVTLTAYEEYRYLRVPYVLKYRAVEEAQVVGITKCNGPSGKCYIVKSRVIMYIENPKTGKIEKQKVYTYEFYVDYKTGVVTYAKYGKLNTEPIQIRLIKWKISG